MADAWYNASWSNRRKITFDNSGQAENLTDFPVLVKLNSTRIDYAKTQNSGQDIRFTDSDGTTLLSYEIETWNESGDSFVWVKVPQINASSSTDYIYVYYGNAGASDAQAATSVWRSEYKGVWHLKETGAGTASEYKDSTSNANHGRGGGGTAGQIPSANTSGAIGTAQTFDGSNDYIALPDAASLYASGSFSVGAWVKRTGTPGTYGGYIFSDYEATGNQSSYSLKITNANTVYFGWEYAGTEASATSAGTLALNTWAFVVGTWDGTTKRIYINGSADGTNNMAHSRGDTGGASSIGRPGAFDGLYCPANIDQVWLYSGALSAAWIAAQYKSEADTFNTYGSEEAQSGGTNALTATDIAAGAVVLGTPTIGQVHALTATGIAAGAAVVGAPAVGQVHALSAVGITAGTPVLDAPALAHIHVLTTAGITAGAPALDAPTVGQIHSLSAGDIAAGAAVLGTPTVGQTHALAATGITTGAAALDTPTLSQTHTLVAVAIAAGTPALDAATIGQVHALTAADITTGAAALGTPSMSGESTLEAAGITTGAPVLDTPTLAQVHVLAAVAIVTGTPALDTPAIGQTHALSADGIVAGTPALGAPSLTGEAALSAGDIVAGVPVLDTPTLGQVHALIAAGVTAGAAAMGTPVISQIHILTAVLIVAGAPTLGTPSMDRAVTPTPDERTFVVAWEDRTYTVSAESRTYTVTGE